MDEPGTEETVKIWDNGRAGKSLSGEEDYDEGAEE